MGSQPLFWALPRELHTSAAGFPRAPRLQHAAFALSTELYPSMPVDLESTAQARLLSAPSSSSAGIDREDAPMIDNGNQVRAAPRALNLRRPMALDGLSSR